MDITVYIRNLPKSTTEDELEALFTQMGDVTQVRIHRDRQSGESKGFGYLSMSTQSEADKAVSRLNNYRMGGLELKVSLAKPRAVSGAASPRYQP